MPVSMLAVCEVPARLTRERLERASAVVSSVLSEAGLPVSVVEQVSSGSAGAGPVGAHAAVGFEVPDGGIDAAVEAVRGRLTDVLGGRWGVGVATALADERWLDADRLWWFARRAAWADGLVGVGPLLLEDCGEVGELVRNGRWSEAMAALEQLETSDPSAADQVAASLIGAGQVRWLFGSLRSAPATSSTVRWLRLEARARYQFDVESLWDDLCSLVAVETSRVGAALAEQWTGDQPRVQVPLFAGDAAGSRDQRWGLVVASELGRWGDDAAGVTAVLAAMAGWRAAGGCSWGELGQDRLGALAWGRALRIAAMALVGSGRVRDAAVVFDDASGTVFAAQLADEYYFCNALDLTVQCLMLPPEQHRPFYDALEHNARCWDASGSDRAPLGWVGGALAALAGGHHRRAERWLGFCDATRAAEWKALHDVRDLCQLAVAAMNDPVNATSIFVEIIDRLRAIRHAQLPVPFPGVPLALLALDLGQASAAREIHRLTFDLPFDTPFDRLMSSLLVTRIAAQEGELAGEPGQFRNALERWSRPGGGSDPSGTVRALLDEVAAEGLDAFDRLAGAGTVTDDGGARNGSEAVEQRWSVPSAAGDREGHRAVARTDGKVRVRVFASELELLVDGGVVRLQPVTRDLLGLLVLAGRPIATQNVARALGVPDPTPRRIAQIIEDSAVELADLSTGHVRVLVEGDEVTLDLDPGNRVDFWEAMRFLSSREPETMRLGCELYPPIPLRQLAARTRTVGQLAYVYSRQWATVAAACVTLAPTRPLSLRVDQLEADEWRHVRGMMIDHLVRTSASGVQVEFGQVLRSIDPTGANGWVDIRFFGDEILVVAPEIGLRTMHRVPGMILFLLTKNLQHVATEYLAGLLWPDVDERRGRGRFKANLYRLRQALGPRGDSLVVSGHEGVSLKIQDDDRVDLREFWAFAASKDRWKIAAAAALADRGLCTQQFRYDDEFEEERRRIEVAALNWTDELATSDL
jgi:hypothetical protein